MMRSLLFLVILTSLTSCPAELETEPSYVTIEGFDLTTRSGEGAPTSAITEVWAFADDEFIGVFPLPGRIPLFRTGTLTLRLEAGVHQDGRSVTPEIYPFYTPFERTLELTGGEIIDLGRPTIGYRNGTVFGLVDGFEEGEAPSFTDPLSPGAVINPQSDVVRSGARAGAITLTDTMRLVELATGAVFRDLNTPPFTVWLEVDFLAEAPTLFGVVGQRNAVPVRVFDPGFLPRSEWTKIYFNLGPVIGSADLDELRIALSTLLPADLGSGTVYLDNLKLLYLRS